MVQRNCREADYPAILTFRAAPRRLSERVEWLLSHDDLDSLLGPGSQFFSEFMDQLDRTLARAFHDRDSRSLLEVHQALYHLYEDTMRPPRPGMGQNQYHPFIMRVRNEIEKAWEAFETARIDVAPEDIPSGEVAFVSYIRELCASQSFAEHPLFNFLEHEADHGQVADFFLHEGTLVLRFCDLIVLSLLGAHEEVRSELAVNFWDEVGEGSYQNRHTELFKRLLRYTGVEMPEAQLTSESLSDRLDWPGLAGYNLYVYFGLHRRNYFRYIGGMGVAEYMDPPQYLKVLRGCRRFGLTDRKALAYYAGHAELDIEHGEAWFTKVMGPLIRQYPDARLEMVQGAIMRINTTADYFDYLHRKLARPSPQAMRPAGKCVARR